MVKNRKSYRTIGEAAKEISVKTHTLRFWEKEFKQLKPTLFLGKRRYYSEKDIDTLKIIFQLLKKQGYSIAGAKKLLNESSVKLDDELDSGIKRKNFQSSLKIKAQRIKIILEKIKELKNGKKNFDKN